MAIIRDFCVGWFGQSRPFFNKPVPCEQFVGFCGEAQAAARTIEAAGARKACLTCQARPRELSESSRPLAASLRTAIDGHLRTASRPVVDTWHSTAKLPRVPRTPSTADRLPRATATYAGRRRESHRRTPARSYTTAASRGGCASHPGPPSAAGAGLTCC